MQILLTLTEAFAVWAYSHLLTPKKIPFEPQDKIRSLARSWSLAKEAGKIGACLFAGLKLGFGARQLSSSFASVDCLRRRFSKAHAALSRFPAAAAHCPALIDHVALQRHQPCKSYSASTGCQPCKSSLASPGWHPAHEGCPSGGSQAHA